MANAFVSFFERVGGWLKKLFTNTTVEHKILAVITYIAPIVEGIIAFADPAIAPFVNRIIMLAQSDLATVTAVVDGAKVTAGTPAAQAVISALKSVQANLNALLTDADVKNSANFAKIEAAANTVLGELEAVLNELVPATPPVTQ